MIGYPKLIPEVKVQWLAALRSGKYKQIRGMLRDIIRHPGGFGYCCLGVLCDTVQPEKWDKNTHMGRASTPAMGLNSEIWQYQCEDGAWLAYNELTRLNDKEGEPFPVIADWIEANL